MHYWSDVCILEFNEKTLASFTTCRSIYYTRLKDEMNLNELIYSSQLYEERLHKFYRQSTRITDLIHLQWSSRCVYAKSWNQPSTHHSVREANFYDHNLLKQKESMLCNCNFNHHMKKRLHHYKWKRTSLHWLGQLQRDMVHTEDYCVSAYVSVFFKCKHKLQYL